MKRKFLSLLAACLCAALLAVPAYAQSNETEAAPAESKPEEKASNPFTPKGTGTVVDEATDEDGKEFYTITTPEENVFFLIIDKQRDAENVYFLNAVTESDLLALAEKDSDTTAPETPVTVEAVPQPAEPETPEEPEQPQKSSTPLTLVLSGRRCWRRAAWATTSKSTSQSTNWTMPTTWICSPLTARRNPPSVRRRF